MQEKQKRLIEIKEIINSQDISKQEELLNILLERGYKLTQATLSRDLKELNVGTKYIDNIGHVYFLPSSEKQVVNNLPTDLNSAVSLEISQNLAVLKTLPGFANSVGAIIDDRKIETIVGTVAGNDTILIVIKENIKKKEFISSLAKEFTNIIKILKP